MKDRFISILEKRAEKCKAAKMKELDALRRTSPRDEENFNGRMCRSYEECIATLKKIDFEEMGDVLQAECDQRKPSFERNAYHNALVLYNDFAQGPEIYRRQMQRENS